VYEPTVVIDCFPECVRWYTGRHAIVAIDVIRAGTTAVTAVAAGRRCFPVPSLEAAARVSAAVPEALMAGEVAGTTPAGFDLGNSPTELAGQPDVARPIILLSSSGTRLMDAAQAAEAAYVGCFRSARILARHLAGRHRRIALLGAGARGQFRVEDQICCAWMAAELMEHGYRAADAATREVVARWRGAPAAACADGASAAYLRRSGQLKDLDFILGHVDDLDAVFPIADGEVFMLPPAGLRVQGGEAAGA
jgi:2-phosphosulfolactate phosphatase